MEAQGPKLHLGGDEGAAVNGVGGGEHHLCALEPVLLAHVVLADVRVPGRHLGQQLGVDLTVADVVAEVADQP